MYQSVIVFRMIILHSVIIDFHYYYLTIDFYSHKNIMIDFYLYFQFISVYYYFNNWLYFYENIGKNDPL